MPSRPMVLHSTVAPSDIVITIESRQPMGKKTWRLGSSGTMA